MATIDLGKIKQVFRGTYNNATAYAVDDLVVFTDGSVTSTYICTTASTGNNPSSGGTAHANWAFVAKGQATSPTTTQGDLVFRGASADQRLAIGTAGQVLKVNSGANGYEFGTGGGIAQVLTVQDSSTGSLNLSTTHTLYDIPNMNVTITPASSSSKFLISYQIFGETDSGGVQAHSIVLKRAISGGATTLIRGNEVGSRTGVFNQQASIYYNADNDSTPEIGTVANYLDSPSASAAVTYTVQMQDHEATGVFYYNRCVNDNNSAERERGMSWLTIMEVVV